MRTIFSFLLVCLSFTSIQAETFTSLDAFMKYLSTYDFSSDSEKLSHYLSIEEPRQPEMPARIVYPVQIESATILWKTDDRAIACVTARPATESTPTETGLLLALEYSGARWHIGDRIHIKAIGKYADIQFKFTGGDDSPPPVVTITTMNGGRGASYSASASYELLQGRFIRKEL